MSKGLSRWYLLLIGSVAALLVGALAVLAVDRAMRTTALAETRAAAESDAAILAAGLESELNKFSLVPRVLAVDPEVAALLTGNQAERDVLNRRLSALARQTNAAAIYLMDSKGTTLAASNWDRPTSFVGSNYGFRDYFAGAVREGNFTEFALGTVSRRPGLYIAERVGPATAPIGVVAVKVEFDGLERKWRDAETGVFVTDTDGIVLLSSNPDWRFRAAASDAKGAPASARDPARDELRFGVSRVESLSLPLQASAASPVKMIEKIQPIAPVGWELHLLTNPAPRLSAAIANGRFFVLLGLVLFSLAGTGVYGWSRRRQAQARAAMAQQTAVLREQLQQANRLATLGQVTAGLGHEIRQPLAAMQVYAENGSRLLAAGRTGEASENFDKITGLARKIGDIIAESLQFSRRRDGEAKQVALGEVIDGSLLLLRDQAKQRGVTLVLPEADAGTVKVRARHVQLEQVLVNLLQNAMQACGAGGRVALSIMVHSGFVHLAVNDSGPGVPPELRDTLFQPFVTGRAEGIGLGLAIARDIMRQLGGDLVVDDKAGGATFTMVIPAA